MEHDRVIKIERLDGSAPISSKQSLKSKYGQAKYSMNLLYAKVNGQWTIIE